MCGFGAGVLNTVPIVKSFSCCMIIPLAAVISLVLEQRSRGVREEIKVTKAASLGLLTGIFAALFGTLLEVLVILITKNSDLAAGLPAIEQMANQMAAQEVVKQMLDIMYKMVDDIANYGFSFLYTFSILVSSLIVNSIFGTLGGLLGMSILNSRLKNDDSNF